MVRPLSDLSNLGGVKAEKGRARFRAAMHIGRKHHHGPPRESRSDAEKDLRIMQASKTRGDVPRVAKELREQAAVDEESDEEDGCTTLADDEESAPPAKRSRSTRSVPVTTTAPDPGNAGGGCEEIELELRGLNIQFPFSQCEVD